MPEETSGTSSGLTDEDRKTAAGLMAASTMGALALEFISEPGVYERWVEYEHLRRTPEQQGTPPDPIYIKECSLALIWLSTILMDEDVVLKVYKDVVRRNKSCSDGGDSGQ